MKIIIIPILIFINFITATNALAEGAGLEVNYNNVRVSIIYNDNVEDRITGVEYIRQPSGALFDVIYILQNNSKAIAKLNKDIQANIDNYSGHLSVYQEEQPASILLRINSFKTLDNKALLTAICKGLNLEKCSIGKDATVDLYMSDSFVDNSNTDLIDFGCFPCKNNKTITLTDRYSPVKSNPYPPKFKKVTVNRQSIYHYFNKLRD